MPTTLSEKARAFLQERRFAVLATLPVMIFLRVMFARRPAIAENGIHTALFIMGFPSKALQKT